MIRWVELGRARVPGDGGELRLMQRGTEYSIMAGSIELMNSRLSGSEETLASLTCARLGARARQQVLIGGLGMGFTLRAALTAWGADAAITVAELVPEVVAWARGPLAGLHGDSLSDSRVTVFEGDVAALIGARRGAWDAILLDVDNGPEGLTRGANDELYDDYGLHEAHGALKRGGVLAVWSAAPDAVFSKRLRAAGFAVEESRPYAHGRKGTRHVVWLGKRS
jgi:spermidine synthase